MEPTPEITAQEQAVEISTQEIRAAIQSLREDISRYEVSLELCGDADSSAKMWFRDQIDVCKESLRVWRSLESALASLASLRAENDALKMDAARLDALQQALLDTEERSVVALCAWYSKPGAPDGYSVNVGALEVGLGESPSLRDAIDDEFFPGARDR